MSPDLELVLRSAAVALALAAAVACGLRPGRRSVRALAALAIGGIAAFVVASTRGGIQVLGLAIFPPNAWCLATPFIVWLLARDVFLDDGRPGWKSVAGLGAYAAVASAADWGRFALGPLGAWPGAASLAFQAVRAAGLVLLVAACVIAVLEWRADLVEARRRARAGFVVVISAVFMAFAASEWLFAGAGAPPAVRIAGLGLLGALAFALLQLVARGGLDALFAEAARREAPSLVVAAPVVRLASDAPGVEAALAKHVVAQVKARQLWKRERLGIAELAALVGTQEYLLRRAINGHLGYRNFNDFLHDWRLQEAAGRLGDPAQSHLPVLSIALDCGYGSIGPFNRAFKSRFGLTPTQYRALRESGQDVADSGAGKNTA